MHNSGIRVFKVALAIGYYSEAWALFPGGIQLPAPPGFRFRAWLVGWSVGDGHSKGGAMKGEEWQQTARLLYGTWVALELCHETPGGGWLS